MASVGIVDGLAKTGDGLGESSIANNSDVASSWGCTNIEFPGDNSHRNSMRLSVKKSRPLGNNYVSGNMFICRDRIDCRRVDPHAAR